VRGGSGRGRALRRDASNGVNSIPRFLKVISLVQKMWEGTNTDTGIYTNTSENKGKKASGHTIDKKWSTSIYEKMC